MTWFLGALADTLGMLGTVTYWNNLPYLSRAKTWVAILGSCLKSISTKSMRPFLISSSTSYSRLFMQLLIATLVTRCVSMPESGPRERTHYVLHPSPWKHYAYPLPHYRSIFLEWHYSDGSVQRTLGFHGWDFNRDGRIDMVEEVNKNATVPLRAYDFDFDGNPDILPASKLK